MKKTLILMIALALVTFGTASADSLRVENAAAMGGVADQDCTGAIPDQGAGDDHPGPCGLEVLHDNTTTAFVEDNTPSNETIYRFEYLFDPNDIAATGSQDWTMTLFGAMGPNPRPNNGANPCPLNPNIPVFPMRVTLIATGASNSTPVVRATMMSNICGVIGAQAFVLSPSGPVKVCGYFIQGVGPIPGPQVPGEVGVAVVASGDPCPADGDPAYRTASTNNDEHSVTIARMGSLGINGFGAGEDGSVYFDEFASFRTLAP